MHRRGVNSAIISTNVYHSQFGSTNSNNNNLPNNNLHNPNNLTNPNGLSTDSDEMRSTAVNAITDRRSASFLLLDDTSDDRYTSSTLNTLQSHQHHPYHSHHNSITTNPQTHGLPTQSIMPIDDMVFKNSESRAVNHSLLFNNENIGSSSWERVEQKGQDKPCPRSSSASVIYKDSLFLFGGFTFSGRLEEIYEYNFKTQRWSKLLTKGTRPSARENNGAVIYENKLYVYGGYDGVSWFKDFYSLDFSTLEWSKLNVLGDQPSQSFGFASARFESTFGIFGGFEGSTWLNDYFTYDFLTQRWKKIQLKGHVPSERSCPSYCAKDEYLYIFGGFNGIDKLHDFYRINIKKAKCTFIQQKGSIPSPRYFHSQIYYADKIYLFGGYNGQIRLNDLFEFSITTSTWIKIDQKEPPAGRSSMVLQIYQDSLFLFGGYNGSNVLSDFYKFRFQNAYLPQSQFNLDIFSLLDNPTLSDVQFQVENTIIHANKAILACRSEYFKQMFSSGLSENFSQENQLPVIIHNISLQCFRDVLQFIYSDQLQFTDDDQSRAVELLQVADLYFLDRLKFLCEQRLVNGLGLKNAIELLILSHAAKASFLKGYAMKYTMIHLNELKVLPSFQQLTNEPGLLMEIIMNKQ